MGESCGCGRPAQLTQAPPRMPQITQVILLQVMPVIFYTVISMHDQLRLSYSCSVSSPPSVTSGYLTPACSWSLQPSAMVHRFMSTGLSSSHASLLL